MFGGFGEEILRSTLNMLSEGFREGALYHARQES